MVETFGHSNWETNQSNLIKVPKVVKRMNKKTWLQNFGDQWNSVKKEKKVRKTGVGKKTWHSWKPWCKVFVFFLESENAGFKSRERLILIDRQFDFWSSITTNSVTFWEVSKYTTYSAVWSECVLDTGLTTSGCTGWVTRWGSLGTCFHNVLNKASIS